MPECPNCQKDIDTIYTNRAVQLIYENGGWTEETVDEGYHIFLCPQCLVELSPAELDKLGVPENMR